MIPNAILDQIDAWHDEGHSDEHILSELLSQYPNLTSEQLEALHLVLNLPYQSEEAAQTRVAMAQLLQLQQQRQQLLTTIESRLSGETVPVSLFNLYRGVLRDQEASLWKLMQHQTPVHKTTISKKSGTLSKPITKTQLSDIAIHKKRSGCCSLITVLLLAVFICLTVCFTAWLPITPGVESISSSSHSLCPVVITQARECHPVPICLAEADNAANHQLTWWRQNISRRKQRHTVE